MPIDKTKQDEIINLARDLMSIESTPNRPDMQIKCIDLICDKYQTVFKTFRFDIDGHPAVVLTNSNDLSSEVTFSGHIDVVSGEPQLFSPIIEDDRLSGRGAYDMKAAIALYVVTAADYIKSGGQRKVAVVITSDEETTGNGTRSLIEELGLKTNFAIICDGGTDTKIVTKQKGGLHVKIRLTGKSAHGAYPWRGDNPILKAFKLYEDLTRRFPEPTEYNQWQTSVMLSRIETSNSINQVPGEAYLYLDARYIDPKDNNEIQSIIKNHVASTGDIEILNEHKMFSTDTDNSYVKKLAQSMQKFNSEKISYDVENGASDAVYFSLKDMPAALFRPIGANLHQSDEWVSIASLENCFHVLLDFLTN
ncbi:M20/M25/M40 family metallo-hydrolase [Candidatus Saccharibacteria bacterium]|nr:M20/M25/M40 family metallo-hydrolase [Candidatus Saccharibacteria bacterium]